MKKKPLCSCRLLSKLLAVEPVAGCPCSCTGSGLPSGLPVNVCTYQCGADRMHRCLLPSHSSRITLTSCSSQFSWEILWALSCFPIHSGHRTEKSAVLLHHQHCWISYQAVGTCLLQGAPGHPYPCLGDATPSAACEAQAGAVRVRPCLPTLWF